MEEDGTGDVVELLDEEEEAEEDVERDVEPSTGRGNVLGRCNQLNDVSVYYRRDEV
ncbi:hypothetical protein GUITHDRAFT_150443 [Guillardia theta CCMP2712]|uniref:Uncharacterized protein n=1 Tax=Guillardia theta (strain CCMP2712) TaxID=905079 RepID=L1JW76_GUITC|nr:hypothetical protein GUITHDRAFT_150443 [Guillardia theta CCMP2712]EKX52811.1 hypothetical protein GUITHDRAFT_150443 [Guillardia theta CCMP2712]|eukprot:XP_005839791.1 hypothetical protein GUITHDRAFT_150443 [Guillardia theta CCMP2712]